ncbi:MAG: hypothetical protein D6B27_10450 [Gammaproteobacteria bacterium]|nr:MAG: hypothetical protein D6B27_10450 [Gammaproteobacteria bacterium]
MPMDDDEQEENSQKRLPEDHLHKSVTKAGLIILAIAFYMLLYPMWDVLKGYSDAEGVYEPLKEQFTSLKKEQTELAKADPESPVIEELIEKQKVMQIKLVEKLGEYRFFQRKFIIFLVVMLLFFLTGMITAIVGLAMCSEYRSNFKEDKKKDEEEDDEEGGDRE